MSVTGNIKIFFKSERILIRETRNGFYRKHAPIRFAAQRFCGILPPLARVEDAEDAGSAAGQQRAFRTAREKVFFNSRNLRFDFKNHSLKIIFQCRLSQIQSIHFVAANLKNTF